MRKRLFTLAILVMTVFAVSAIAGAQAYSPTEKKDRCFLLQVGCTSGTWQVYNLESATVYDVYFWGTGTVSGMEKVTLTGTEVDTFNSPPPTFTHLYLMGTVTLTDSAGDTLTITYHCSQGTQSSPYRGTYQITGGTGQFFDAEGGGLSWGTDALTNPATGTGVYTQDFLGEISF